LCEIKAAVFTTTTTTMNSFYDPVGHKFKIILLTYIISDQLYSTKSHLKTNKIKQTFG